jgi:hypothetical protein
MTSMNVLKTRSIALTILLAVALLAPGCAGGTDPREEQEQDILAAVQIHLREQRNMNPDGMGMEITGLVLDGDQAQATIQFTSPDGGSNLEVQYLLTRGDDGWTVTGTQGPAGHGGGIPEGMPPDHPPIPEDPPQETDTESPPESS